MAKKPETKKQATRNYGERFRPEVGWLVSNMNANVFFDPVISVTDTDFTCKTSGTWSGTTDGWIYHNNITPKDEN